jgi:hypothetical protein
MGDELEASTIRPLAHHVQHQRSLSLEALIDHVRDAPTFPSGELGVTKAFLRFPRRADAK